MSESAGRVLFLCTGNYYRSRFAEAWFNHLAERAGLGWRADSAGLKIDAEQRHNVGPMSPNAISALDARGLSAEPHLRLPRAVRVADFVAADRVVAVLRDEHEPMIREAFEAHAEVVIYWDIRDVPPSAEYDPMAEVEQRIEALVSGLRADGGAGAQAG